MSDRIWQPRCRSWRGRFPYLLAILTLLAVWQIASFFLPSFLLPGVPAAGRRLVEVIRGGEFLGAVQASLLRLAVGYPLACLLGAVLGLLAGLSRTFAAYLRGLISVLQSIPPITWVPFMIILLGFGNLPIILVITIASFFPMALSVLNATEGVSRTHLEVARVLGASRPQLLTRVYGPETLPAVLSGAQVAFGNAWRSLIAGEMVGGTSSGLGWSISFAGEVADMAGVLVGITVVGTLAAVIDHLLLGGLRRRLLRWQHQGAGEGE